MEKESWQAQEREMQNRIAEMAHQLHTKTQENEGLKRQIAQITYKHELQLKTLEESQIKDLELQDLKR